MGKNRKYMGWFLCIVYMIIFAAVTQASEIKEHGKGLLLDDDEFLESLPEIVDVRMNRQAIEKLKASGNIQTRLHLMMAVHPSIFRRLGIRGMGLIHVFPGHMDIIK